MEYDSIVGTATISGRTAYQYNSSQSTQPSYIATDSLGNLDLFIDTSNGQGRGIWMQQQQFSPITIGTKDTVNFPGLPIGTYERIQTYLGNFSIPLPEGTFGNAKGFQTLSSSDGSTITDTSYFAAGVGQIKNITINPMPLLGADTMRYISELVSYSVK